MAHHRPKHLLALILGSFLLSCAPAQLHAYEEPTPVEEEILVAGEPMAKQLSSSIKKGLQLDMSSFTVSIPSKTEGKENVLDFSGACAKLRLDELSLHGLEAEISADIDYNGVKKDVDLLLSDQELYFSLVDHLGQDGFRFKTSIEEDLTRDAGIDETTRGTIYYEYGSLDYFLYSIFESFDIPAISLDSTFEKGSIEIDFAAIAEASEQIQQVSSHLFRFDLPLGDESLSFGLHSNSSGVLSKIDFPYGGGSHEFSNGVKLAFEGNVGSFSNAFSLPYDESSYLELEDSLELIKEIGKKVSNRRFGLNASLSIVHIEDAVEGSIDLFEREEVYESVDLEASANVDLSKSYHNVSAGLTLSSESSSRSFLLHIDDDLGNAQCYFDFNSGILKGRSSVAGLSNLWSAITDLFGDEAIQNDKIMALLSGLLATLDSISIAIDGIKESVVMTDVSEGHYEGILGAISNVSHTNNRITVSLDLAKAGGHGNLSIVLDSSSESLVSIDFEEAGIVTKETPTLSLLLTGSITIGDYKESEFEREGYEEFRHIPSLATSLNKFADSDQVSANIRGYLRKKGTTAISTYTTPSWNGTSTFSEEGFTFSGSLGMDLVEKTGAGRMTFVDRKEGYFNDHNIALDVTGGEGEGDSDEKDLAGTAGGLSETGYMLFKYDSINADMSRKSAENRTQPSEDPLYGRFSVHSLDSLLDVVSELLSSTDARFKRLTNLFNNVMTESIISSILDGKYLTAIAGGLIESSEISGNGITVSMKKGFIYTDYDLSIRALFGEDYLDEENVLQPGKIKSIEILSQSPSQNEGTDIYACIEMNSASFPDASSSFNFVNKNGNGNYAFKSGYSLSTFTDFSSIKTLAQFLYDTITLGMTDDTVNSYTTYHATGTIKLSVLGFDIEVDANAWIYLKGTEVKVFGNLHTPRVVFATNADTACNFFYETDGSDSSGTLYLARNVKENYGFLNLKSRNVADYKKVTGENFMGNLVDWLFKYMMNLTSTITDRFDSESSSTEAFHGEDIIKGFEVTNASINAPKWKLSIGLEALAHTSILNDLDVEIAGITAKYTGNDGKAYSKKSLYSLSGSTTMLLIVKASLNFTMGNIASSTGAYTDAWNVKKAIYYTEYSSTNTSLTASAIWNGTYGKTSANSNYRNANWYIGPETLGGAPA